MRGAAAEPVGLCLDVFAEHAIDSQAEVEGGGCGEAVAQYASATAGGAS